MLSLLGCPVNNNNNSHVEKIFFNQIKVQRNKIILNSCLIEVHEEKENFKREIKN